jgi:hypothetical protein
MTLIAAPAEVRSILLLHRHSDGIISFAVETGDDWRPVHAVRADQLENMFPEFRVQLLRDSFVSINAAHRMSRRSRGSVGLPSHRAATLRYLCACYCDIDFYKRGLTYAQAVQLVRDSVTANIVPPFSAMVRSGQGLWIFWLLQDEQEPGQAHLGAYSDNRRNHLQLYQQINREIGRRLSPVGADPAATDAARYVRVPGSFRSDVETEIIWEWVADANEKGVSYTLRNLATTLGVGECKQRTDILTSKPEGKCRARRRGFDVANSNKLTVLKALQELRGGGFCEGQRNIAAFILAACLKWNGYSMGDSVEEVKALAQACRPALPDRECLTAVQSAYKATVKKMSYRYIADSLDVTPWEAQLVSDKIKKTFPSAARFCAESAASHVTQHGGRATRRLLRRLEIQKLVEDSDTQPSSRRLQAMLQGVGIKVGHVTVATDLRWLEAAGRIGHQRSSVPDAAGSTSSLFSILGDSEETGKARELNLGN